MTAAVIASAHSWPLWAGNHAGSTALAAAVIALLIIALTFSQILTALGNEKHTGLARVLDAAALPLLLAFCLIVGRHVVTDIIGWRP